MVPTVKKNITTINIISEYGGNISSRLMPEMFSAPIIYPFDFVSGAGAMVIMPGDDRNCLHRRICAGGQRNTYRAIALSGIWKDAIGSVKRCRR